jgi:hypothetical protein
MQNIVAVLSSTPPMTLNARLLPDQHHDPAGSERDWLFYFRAL